MYKKKIYMTLLIFGLIGGGYLSFESWMRIYHAPFAQASDVKQQVDGLKMLYQQSRDIQIETQINGLNTEKRIITRQINDLGLKAKKMKLTDTEIYEYIVHIIKDLAEEVKIINEHIGALRRKLTN